MKVRINYVVEVDSATRRAIAEAGGQTGMASRGTVKAWYETHGRSLDDDLNAWTAPDATEEVAR